MWAKRKRGIAMPSSTAAFYTAFAQRFQAWAADQEDIRAAFIIGSRAREDHPADEWSDMDILFYTTCPQSYLQHEEWLDALGQVVSTFSTATAGGDPERLTLFEGGYQVDFVVAPLRDLQQLSAAGTVHGNFYRGVKVLLDKDGLAPAILPREQRKPAVTPLSQEGFAQVCHPFWFGTLYVAKQILRGELWVAKAWDPVLKGLLLQMLEWQARAVHGPDYDTWHAGRFIQEWADPDVWAQLQRCFGHLDAQDSWRALEETARLFQRLSHDVAGRQGYPVVPADSRVCQWMADHAQAARGQEA